MISICASVIRGVASRSKKSINESIVFMRQYGFGYAPQNERVFGRFKAIKQGSGSFDYARRLIASGAAISVCHPAAIYRRWRTFLYCRISVGIRIASQIRRSFFLDSYRLAARCVPSPIREQQRASIGHASGFQLVSRASSRLHYLVIANKFDAPLQLAFAVRKLGLLRIALGDAGGSVCRAASLFIRSSKAILARSCAAEQPVAEI